MYRRQGARPSPTKRNAKRQNGCLRRQTAVKREAKSKGERERYSHLNAEFQRIARSDKKGFLSDHCKEREKPVEWERLEISSRKLEIPSFMQR